MFCLFRSFFIPLFLAIPLVLKSCSWHKGRSFQPPHKVWWEGSTALRGQCARCSACKQEGYLMRLYSARNLDDKKHVFNYRLSRARRSVEWTFGIMCTKWRIVLKYIETDERNATSIGKAICNRHNFVLEPEGKSKFVLYQRSIASHLLPRLSGQEFWIILTVWDLCHGKMIVLCRKTFCNATIQYKCN